MLIRDALYTVDGDGQVLYEPLFRRELCFLFLLPFFDGLPGHVPCFFQAVLDGRTVFRLLMVLFDHVAFHIVCNFSGVGGGPEEFVRVLLEDIGPTFEVGDVVIVVRFIRLDAVFLGEEQGSHFGPEFFFSVRFTAKAGPLGDAGTVQAGLGARRVGDLMGAGGVEVAEALEVLPFHDVNLVFSAVIVVCVRLVVVDGGFAVF